MANEPSESKEVLGPGALAVALFSALIAFPFIHSALRRWRSDAPFMQLFLCALLVVFYGSIAALVTILFERRSRRMQFFQKQRAPWLQFHLSTLLLLTIVMAGLLYLNLEWQISAVVHFHGSGAMYGITADTQGWPYPWRIRTASYPTLEVPSFLPEECLADLLIAGIILIVLGVICEKRIRNKAR